jgi:hypothetical protein
MSSWTRPFAVLVVIALALGACGGGSSQSPSSQGTGSPAASGAPASAAPASAAPAPSEGAATAAPTTNAQGPNIGGAAAALANLDSYHLKTVMKMKGMTDSLFSAFGDGMEMEGTIIFRPTQAADIAISMGTEAQKLAMGYRLIGDKAWISLGDTWTETSAADAQKTLDGFAPEKMLGSFAGMPGLTAVGDETRNGVETVHYSASGDAIGSAIGDSIGLPGADWTVDFWVAKDAGYAVGYAIAGKNATGSFDMTLDVSDINSPSNSVEPPPAGG